MDNKPIKRNNLVGVTGEYFVCAELGRLGLIAIPAQKNNPLFDIIATDNGAKRIVAIQVKTMSEHNKQGWNIGMKITSKKYNENLFVVLVNLKKEGVDYYIYKYDELSDIVNEIYNEYINTPKKDKSKRKDTNIRWVDLKNVSESNHNNWDKLGFEF